MILVFPPLQSINVHIDENALHEILNEVDLNKNGQIEIDEFLQVRHTDSDNSVGGVNNNIIIFIFSSFPLHRFISSCGRNLKLRFR